MGSDVLWKTCHIICEEFMEGRRVLLRIVGAEECVKETWRWNQWEGAFVVGKDSGRGG